MKAHWMLVAAALLALPAHAQTGPSKAAQQLVKTIYPTDAALATDIEVGTFGAPVTQKGEASSAREAIGALVGCQMTEANARRADDMIGKYTALSRVRLVLAQYYDKQYSPAELQQLQRFLASAPGRKFLTSRADLAGKASLATQKQALKVVQDTEDLCRR